MEKFFIATDELEDKKLKFLGWKGPKVGGTGHLRKVKDDETGLALIRQHA